MSIALGSIDFYPPPMPRMFHVSSVRNRASIQRHGLDWSRMGDAPGIAGSPQPEAAGVFLAPDEFQARFFVRINNTGGPVDLWSVDDVPVDDLIGNGTGFGYVPYRIDRQRLSLLARDLEGTEPPPRISPQGRRVGQLTVTSSDGTEAFTQPVYFFGADGDR
jgi:hypothetical protein